MLFNSVAFFVFAALFFAVWPLVCRQRRPRLAAIALASLVFYGFWDPRYVLVLLGTGIADFSFGLAMERAPSRKRWLLGASLTLNLGALFAFKYSSFVAQTVDATLALLGKSSHAQEHVPALLRVLPPGISFYTFQSMSYTIDVYTGRLKPTRSPLHFLAFISMFPQLVAGPIVRAKDLLPALETHTPPSPEARFSALSLIVFGYFKKVVIADHLAATVESVYGAPGKSSLLYWLATLMFALQIYFDFSGYSDIARGLARLMGYEFPLNFAHPYTARSMRELWQRWHISLSTWFRDYVYLPLGGARSHPLRNLWVTMLLSGLWHGASFTFLAWGAWHALWLSVERATRWPERAAASPVGRALAAPAVFMLTLIGWVFFRAGTLGNALTALRTMFTQIPNVRDLALLPSYMPVFFLAVGVLTEALLVRATRRAANATAGERALPVSGPATLLRPLGLALLIAICVYFRGPGTAFIYFQF